MPPQGDTLRLFDMQRFCVHDGPGIRTVVFLKGCPLRCRWCQNPESLHGTPETAFFAERCTGCFACRDACPHGAIVDDSEESTNRIDREACQACGACADVCPAEAVRLIGWEEQVEELLDDLLRDRTYFEATGGGITLSGGEPLLQVQAASALLEACKDAGLHTAVETSGAVPFSAFEEVLPHTDLFYVDLKAGDDTLHRELTGAPLDRVTDNARQLAGWGGGLAFRMPIIPGLNDTDDSLRGVAELLAELGHDRIRLLPYHRGGEDKLDRIGVNQQHLHITPDQADAAIAAAVERFAGHGITAAIEGGGDTPRASDPFSDRVHRLRAAVQTAKPAICIERAVHVTAYHRVRRNRRKPAPVRNAEALQQVLRQRTVRIHDDELLVGCFSSHRVGGSIFPELHGVAQCEDLLSYSDRELNPLALDPDDRRTLALKVLPLWSTRFLTMRAFSTLRALRFVRDQFRGDRFLINETGGISHLVPDYDKLLAVGTAGIATEARQRGAETDDPAKRDFYLGVEIACLGLDGLAEGFANEARSRAEADPDRRDELKAIAERCAHVPHHPARTLAEALQSLLFAQIAINAESLDNSVCPGRLDQVLLPYFRADVHAGRLDEAGARELIGCFTVKMCEIVPVFSSRITRFHGGLFNGQVVVVGGTDADGEDATNELTWLFLDAVEHLRMRQPNYHARVHAHSPPAYLERIAAMLRDGSGSPSLMNDEAVVPMMIGRGTDPADARDYSPVGCVEPVSCGRTFGSTDAALVSLPRALEYSLGTKKGGEAMPSLADCGSMQDVVDRLQAQFERLVDDLLADLQPVERANAEHHPTPLTSMLLQGCLESGVDASSGGARYNYSGVQGVGVTDVADSLAAIEDVVFERGLCDLATLAAALKHNFAGHGSLRGHLVRAPKFGNDDPVADRWADVVMGLWADALGRHTNTRGGPYVAGFYSVTAHRAFGETVGALPSGRPSGAPLANGLSPSTGLDRHGPTATLNSVAGLDLVHRARNGINVNLGLDRGALRGATGVHALAGLVRGYFDQGGMQVQVNVFDPAFLRAAIDDPDANPWLLVRVSGYSAYFNDLSPEMKREIVERMQRMA
jgi:pyruvate formate-lyase/glycerol dehydratase family glycyl radical enzyme/glycyl-radical enzyme activating protein